MSALEFNFFEACLGLELESFINFFEVMYSTQISVDMKDKVFWKLSKNGCFHVCLYCKALRENDVLDFPWQEIWRVKAPLRVAFFVQMVFLALILIIEIFMKQVMLIVSQCDVQT